MSGAREGWRQRLCAVCRRRTWYSWRNGSTCPVPVKNGRTYGAWVELPPGAHACGRCVRATEKAKGGHKVAKLEHCNPATEADMVPCERCEASGSIETDGGAWVPGVGQTIVAAARGRRRCPLCRGGKRVPS